ncbi:MULTISPECIES: hypothetical protein [unclassified Bradyrhizobium]|uniref:hypothetical protein n=1 Tax=unclassified Bradyrhizobium TaxID=2631580 RepID=UPI002916A04A|nr:MULTISPECIES: hypothetical protein [unclassified Bradyrhizobium]
MDDTPDPARITSYDDLRRTLAAAHNPSLKLGAGLSKHSKWMDTLRTLDAINSPSLKLVADMSKHSKWVQSLRTLGAVNNPSLKLVAEMSRHSNWAQTLRALNAVNNPSLKVVAEMSRHSNWAQTLRAMAAVNNPSLKLVAEMSRHSNWAQTLRALDAVNNPSLKLMAEVSKHSKWMQTLRTLDPLNSPSLKLVAELSKNLRLARASDAVNEPPTSVRDAANDPAERLAMVSAAILSEISDVEFASASDTYLEQLAQAIKSYLPTVQSLPVIVDSVERIIMLALAILSVYYASQSATGADIDRVKTSIDHQTDVIESTNSRIELRFRELLELAERLAQERISEIAPRYLYVAKRSVAAKAMKSMRSPAAGVIEMGATVAVVTFDRKWIEVEFFDPLSGRAARGWVTKKNFIRIEKH